MEPIDAATIRQTRRALAALDGRTAEPIPQRVLAELTGYSTRQVKRYERDGGPVKFRAALIGAVYTVSLAGRGPEPVDVKGLVPLRPDALQAWYRELRA